MTHIGLLRAICNDKYSNIKLNKINDKKISHTFCAASLDKLSVANKNIAAP